jgi:hypothetical protein
MVFKASVFRDTMKYKLLLWAILALPLALRAGDFDGDGIEDTEDNCIEVVNPEQRDTDRDGFGNICDPDFNQNNIVDPADFSLLKQRFGQTGFPDQDLNGNGIVDPVDFSLLKQRLGHAPGPSGVRSVSLSWEAPTQNEDGTVLTNLDDYKVLYGPLTGYYPNEVLTGLVTDYELILPRGEWFFVVRAINTGGTESQNSNEASKLL